MTTVRDKSGKTLRSAQNETYGVVILNPSTLLRINCVKNLILKLSHYPESRRRTDARLLDCLLCGNFGEGYLSQISVPAVTQSTAVPVVVPGAVAPTPPTAIVAIPSTPVVTPATVIVAIAIEIAAKFAIILT